MVDGGAAVLWRPDRVIQCNADTGDVWLLGGPHPIRLSGRFALPLAQVIDGKRSMAEIADALAAQGSMSIAQANAALTQWLVAGHVRMEVAPSAAPAVQLAQGDSTEHVSLRQALELSGIEVRTDSGVCTVVLVDDLLDLADLPIAGPWIPVRLRGDEVLVGPLLGPGAGCPTCTRLRHRARRRSDVISAQAAGLPKPPPSPVIHPSAPLLAAGVIASSANAMRIGKPPIIDGFCLSMNPSTLEVSRHGLVPIPGCPACDAGGSSIQHTERDQTPQAGTTNDGGGLRTADPEETWRNYEHLIGPIFGVVPEVQLKGDAEYRVHVAGFNPGWHAGDDLDQLRSSLRQSAMGKGLTIAGSRAGALAEALERHSLIWRGDEPVINAQMAELDGVIIHPNDIQLFSAAQLAAREVDDDVAHRFHYVPAPFDEDGEHSWVRMHALSGAQGQAWMPARLAYLGVPGGAPGALRACSNGVAAGNTMDEALLQGLLELVERDAVALWWYPRAHRPGIDLTSTADPRVHAARSPLLRGGRVVWALDLTTDLGIPAVVAFSSDPDGSRIISGFGAHLDPVVAVVRALTEVAQGQSVLAEMSPADELLMPPQERDWYHTVTTLTDPWLAPHGLVPLAEYRPMSLAAALDTVVHAIANVGIDTYWMDLTRRDIGLPVVRTVAPGLRHFWNRFAPGRLYDIPLALGWVEQPIGEADLNPRWMFL